MARLVEGSSLCQHDTHIQRNVSLVCRHTNSSPSASNASRTEVTRSGGATELAPATYFFPPDVSPLRNSTTVLCSTSVTVGSNASRKAAIYTRISLDMGGDKLAVTRQREACEKLVRQREWELTEIYEDNSVSAPRL